MKGLKKRRTLILVISAIIVMGILSFIVFSEQDEEEEGEGNVTVDGQVILGQNITIILDNETINVTVYLLEFTRKPDGYGKSQVSFPTKTKIKYAKDLIDLYPDIDSVSYYDESKETTIGFISAFGGIGKNFKIKKNQIYEVSVKNNVNLTLIVNNTQ
ncbi:hypothetical protein JXA85_00875 [Candidatus Woesearchaeota archaeon]|nr:hypothetical protein [Candidatus Woesearchaeota archaeon]